MGSPSGRPTRARRASAATTLVALLAASLTAVPAYAAAKSAATTAQTAATSSTALGTEQALAKAKSTGAAVPVPAATTSTDTLTANPDGSLTLAQALVPVRKKVAGAWTGLDATLKTNPGGTISTTATSSTLTLSSGGSGPLATMNAGGKTLAVSLPMALPIPTLSGATATYSGVLTGVDLKVTADAQGGFSEVLIVHDATAAANPALKTLVLATQASGVSLSADSAGNITAADTAGHPVFTAPAPTMWDSAIPAAASTVTNPTTGQSVDATSGLPVASSATQPGEAAHVATLAATAATGAIDLTPSQSLLTGTSTAYPVYIDPSFNAPSAGSPQNSWTMVNSAFPTTSYWKSGTGSLMQVGYNGWSAPYFTARGFVNVAVPSSLYGSTVISSSINFTEQWSPSCTATAVQLWSTGSITKDTTWNAQPAWNSQVDSQSVAHGYNSSCPAAGVGFTTTSLMQSAADGKWTNATLGLRAASESDAYGWKQFASATTMSTTYDHTPNKPTGMSTSPSTQCTATTPSTVGDGQVTLYTPVSDPDGGTLGVHYQLWKTSASGTILASSDPNALTYTSGTTAVLNVSEATLKNNSSGITEFSWNVQVTDFNPTTSVGTSPWSSTCNFNFDSTHTGQPVVTPPASVGGLTGTIGTPETFAVAKPTTGTIPSSYRYQLNGADPGTVTADPSGNAPITITPTRFTNTLIVTSLSAGGNIGQSYTAPFNSNPAATATDQDMTGDNIPDLLTAGNQNGLPPGLWLTQGTGTAQVSTAASDLGILGNGIVNDNSPADFNGDQVITGHFNTGANLQDALAYNGTTGMGTFLFGNGDGSPFQPVSGGKIDLNDSTALKDASGNIPQQLANAGNTSGLGAPYPDLIGIANNTLSLYASGTQGQYANADQYYAQISLTPSPDTLIDWNKWTIATAQDTRGGATSTDMYLWNPTSGALYLWEGLAYDTTPGANDLTYASHYTIADGTSTFWNKGANLTLQAVDVNGDGTPELRTIAAGDTVTTYTAALGTTTATLTANSAQTITTSTHSWALDDSASSGATVSSAIDNTAAGTTALALAASTTGATWHTGDLFSPDIALDGAAGHLATATGTFAVNPAASFTLDAWINPGASGGVVLSQDGTNDSSFVLYPNGSQWEFGINNGNTTAWSFDGIVGGSYLLNVWSHLTVTYNASTGVMSLYVNSTLVATGHHTAVSGQPTGPLRIGDDLNGGTHMSNFAGQVAQVQTWSGTALAPSQPYTPAAYHQALTPTRLLDTRGALGDNLTNRGAAGAATPLAANSTLTLQIAKDTVTTASGASTTIPDTATAVAIDLTITSPTAIGYVAAYADGSQRPITSGTNYTTGATVTGYEIVPIGPDGNIALYNASTGTTHILVDITGYYSTDTNATAQTYHPLNTAYRALDTRNGTGGTTGTLAAGAALNLQITGTDGIPTTATAVAITLTTAGETGSGYLQTYATGTTPGNVTALSYTTSALASMAADVPLGTTGQITIKNIASSAATNIIGDISGYYTTDTTGLRYHTINPTRLVDTRSGIGGHTGVITANTPYPITQATTAQVTSVTTGAIATNPTLALNLTATQSTSGGDLVAYPTGGTQPTASNLNFNAGQDIANLALTPTGTGTNAGQITVYNQSAGTVHLVVDCSGYFAAN